MHSLPSIRSFESKDGQKCAPTSITDAFGEGVVPNHVADPQVFMIDRVVGLHQLARFFVVEVAPLPCDVLLGFRQEERRFAPPMAALLAAGYFPSD